MDRCADSGRDCTNAVGNGLDGRLVELDDDLDRLYHRLDFVFCDSRAGVSVVKVYEDVLLYVVRSYGRDDRPSAGAGGHVRHGYTKIKRDIYARARLNYVSDSIAGIYDTMMTVLYTSRDPSR